MTEQNQRRCDNCGLKVTAANYVATMNLCKACVEQNLSSDENIDLDQREWYIQIGIDQIGPITTRALKDYLIEGKISPSTFIKNREGISEPLEQWPIYATLRGKSTPLVFWDFFHDGEKQQPTNKTLSSETTRFKSKEDYFLWKEKKLQMTQSANSKGINCPHCEEPISPSAIVCPYCSENVKEDVLATTPSITQKEIQKPAVKYGHPEVVERKTILAPSPPTTGTEDLKTKIKRLETLLVDGIINQNEFDAKKQQFIDEYLNKKGD